MIDIILDKNPSDSDLTKMFEDLGYDSFLAGAVYPVFIKSLI